MSAIYKIKYRMTLLSDAILPSASYPCEFVGKTIVEDKVCYSHNLYFLHDSEGQLILRKMFISLCANDMPRYCRIKTLKEKEKHSFPCLMSIDKCLSLIRK